MKFHRIAVTFLIFLGAQSLFGQTGSDLIPRPAFFQGEVRFQFKLSPQGDRLYFRSQAAPGAILSMATDAPETVDSLPLTAPLIGWEPLAKGILAVVEEDGLCLWDSEKERKVALPEGASSARILEKNKTGRDRFAIAIGSEQAEVAGIYVYEVEEGTMERRYDDTDGATEFFDGELNLVARHRLNDAGEMEMEWRDKGKWRKFASAEQGLDGFLGGFSRIVSVSADGKTIYHTSNADRDKAQFFAYEVRQDRSRLLAKHDLVDIIPMAASTRADGHVTSVVGLFAKTVRIVTDPKSMSDFGFLQEELDGDVSFVATSEDDQRWLVRSLTGGPTKYYLYDRSNRTLTFLLSDYPALEAFDLATRHAHSVRTSDGIQLPFHVYLPPGSDSDGNGIPDRPLPTILYVHGGPWLGIAHWNGRFHWRNFQLLANRGYAVVNCEFRSSTGLGKRVTELGNKAWGEGMTQDKVAIADWVVEQGIAAPGRVGMWGWSYGGYATLAGLAFSPDTYSCGIAMYGISDLEAFCRIPFADSDTWRNRVGNVGVESDREMLVAHSPYFSIDQIKAPLMLTTGSQDARVPQVQMDKMAEGMADAGKEVVYFYYPEEVHDYRQAESWISFWAAAELFLSDHLGGKFLPGRTDFQSGDLVVVEGEEFLERLE